MSVPAQRSFAGGEIAPALYARTDQLKYQTGLRQCRNLIVRRHGGVSMRSGSGFTVEVKDSSLPVQAKKFVLDETGSLTNYLLELGDRYARFVQNGQQVLVSDVAAWANATNYSVGDLVAQGGINYTCTSAHLSAVGTNKPGVDAGAAGVWYELTADVYEIPMPYVAADLALVQIVQETDTITLVHPSYPPRELKRVSHTRWILSSIVFGPALLPPTNLAVVNAAGGAPVTYWAVTSLLEGSLEESLPAFISAANVQPSAAHPTAVSWNPVSGAIAYNVYRSTDGKTYGLLASSGGTTLLVTDSAWTTDTDTVNTVVPDAWIQSGGQCRNPLAAITVTNKAYDGNYRVYGSVTISSANDFPDVVEGRVRAFYSRDGEPRVDAGPLERSHFSVPGLKSLKRQYTDVINVPDNGYATLVIDLVPEVLGSVDAGVPTFTCTADELTAGWNHIDFGSASVGFTDPGATPDMASAPPQQANVFASVNNYPATVAYYQQRRLFAGTNNDPQTVDASRTGSPASFARSTPLEDDDRVEFTLSGHRVTEVRHLMDLARLLVFTGGAVLQVEGDQSGIIKPDSINPRKIARQGIGRLAPLEVDDSAIYVQARGSIVRDLQPVSAGGADGGYSGKDLTVFAAHLFDGFTIVDWDYAETPNSIVWAVRSDGVLVGLTYLREHGVWGWHRHDTDGFFENVCVVPEGIEDAVYVVVRRTIQGVVKRYIERFTSLLFDDVRDVVRMDSSISYDGRETGVRTITLSGGVNWDNLEELVATASSAAFAGADLDDAIFLTGPATLDTDGNPVAGKFVIATIKAYTSPTIVTVRVDRVVPDEMRNAAIGNGSGSWAKAVKLVTGLGHLEGKAVSVFADGFVEASPNNPAYGKLVVAGGSVTLNRPCAVIHVGLPYIADLETLDVDMVGGQTIKDKQQLLAAVIVFLEASRGVWIGRGDKPVSQKPLYKMQEMKPRQNEPYDSPPALVTEDRRINIDGAWNTNSRILIRQVDPLPLTVLSVSPIAFGDAN